MAQTSRREWIKARAARFPRTLQMKQEVRGVYTGKIAEAVREAASTLGVPVSNARSIRLLLASAVFGREVRTYNELSAAELWALHQWVILGDTAIRELTGWLRANYGEQMSLPQEVA